VSAVIDAASAVVAVAGLGAWGGALVMNRRVKNTMTGLTAFQAAVNSFIAHADHRLDAIDDRLGDHETLFGAQAVTNRHLEALARDPWRGAAGEPWGDAQQDEQEPPR